MIQGLGIFIIIKRIGKYLEPITSVLFSSRTQRKLPIIILFFAPISTSLKFRGRAKMVPLALVSSRGFIHFRPLLSFGHCSLKSEIEKFPKDITQEVYSFPWRSIFGNLWLLGRDIFLINLTDTFFFLFSVFLCGLAGGFVT